MALINCSECSREYSDKAAACPSCGCPNEYIKCPECGEIYLKTVSPCPKCACPTDFAVMQDDTHNSLTPQKYDCYSELNEEERIKKKAVAMERQKLEGTDDNVYTVFGWFFFILAIVAVVAKSWILVIVFLLIAICIYGALIQKRERLAELDKMDNGYKKLLLCPYCKSTNVMSNLVQSGVRQGSQRIRVSDNINPLHPFTHTNVKKSAVEQKMTYGNKYLCNDCGKVFDKVLEVWND